MREDHRIRKGMVIHMSKRQYGTEIRYEFRDITGETAKRVTEQWLLSVPESNPGMFAALEDRDRVPMRPLLPWSGEFIGKHLTALVENYLLTGDRRIAGQIREIVKILEKLQAPDGYLGPWRRERQLTGYAENSHGDYEVMEKGLKPDTTWDAWGLYHLMYGLLGWYQTSGENVCLAMAERMADLLIHTFWEQRKKLCDIGWPETNLAPVHSLAILYEETGKEKYLKAAEQIVEEFGEPEGGDYLRAALEGKEFYELGLHRWESLHVIMGLKKLYDVTGKEDYRTAFVNLWWSMVKTDRHNTGGFTSGEAACGNPYDERPIETCCTVAWTALTVEMLKLERNALIADELELSYYNGGLGAISPSGRWCTYNTPMDGSRFSSMRTIVFQSRPGTPELNCCSVNAPRIPGLLSQWAVMRGEREIYVNYYGDYTASMPGFDDPKTELRLELSGAYPVDGRVMMSIDTGEASAFTLYLRIPYWSKNTVVELGGERQQAVPGTYLKIHRTWKAQEEIRISFDMSLTYWRGERNLARKACIYRGPLLLAADPSFQTEPISSYEEFRGRLCFEAGREGERVLPVPKSQAMLLVEVENRKKQKVRLCDFRSAGYLGNRYVTWFEIEMQEMPPAEFTRTNPRRLLCRADQDEMS